MKKLLLFAIGACWACTSAYGQPALKTSDPNSISQSIRGINYRLTCIGDKLPRLFVNSREISPNRLNDYSSIVSELQARLFNRQRLAEQERTAENDKYLHDIVGDLVASKIIPSTGELTSFRLDAAGLVVNGRKQSFALFSRFQSKYAVSGDKVYSFNTK